MNQHVATTLTASPTPISTALQVKKTMPKQFELKFLGSMSGLAPTLKSTLTDEQGTKVPPQPVVSPDSLLAAACQPPFPKQQQRTYDVTIFCRYGRQSHCRCRQNPALTGIN